MVKEFSVNFFYATEKELLESNKLIRKNIFDDDSWDKEHCFKRSINIEASWEEFEDFINSEFVSYLEEEFGNLIYSNFGFSSLKIELDDAPLVWDFLVDELKRRNLIK